MDLANSNHSETIKAFAEYTVVDFLKAIKKYGVGNYDPRKSKKQEAQKLKDSFQFSVRGSDSHKMSILISFLYHGSFTDWGVGKGVSIEDVAVLSKSRGLTGRIDGQKRRPKKWYTKTIFYEVRRLSEILSEKYGINVRYAVDATKVGAINVTIF